MNFEFYQHLPQYFDPIAFTVGSFAVRWYGLMYIVGFSIVYGLLKLRISRGEYLEVISHQSLTDRKRSKKKDDRLLMTNGKELVLDYLLISFAMALVGGRLGYVLFYNAPYFLAHPWEALLPFDGNGNLVGFYGMSYHGALLGILLGNFFYLRAKKIDFFAWADFVVPAIPLGYFFGRMGNFFNGELYGRVTTSAWGMYFDSSLGQLRHPSQLYEGLLEGIVLFIVLWKLRNKKFKKGTLLAGYLLGYGFFRIIAEQFRQSDPQIGLIFEYFSLGQLLSFLMVLGGLIMLFLINKKGAILGK